MQMARAHWRVCPCSQRRTERRADWPDGRRGRRRRSGAAQCSGGGCSGVRRRRCSTNQSIQHSTRQCADECDRADESVLLLCLLSSPSAVPAQRETETAGGGHSRRAAAVSLRDPAAKDGPAARRALAFASVRPTSEENESNRSDTSETVCELGDGGRQQKDVRREPGQSKGNATEARRHTLGQRTPVATPAPERDRSGWKRHERA